MKKLITLVSIALMFTLTSCSNTPTKVDNPDKVTTVELQNIAKADTNTYKVVNYISPSGSETMFIINPKVDKVVMKVDNNSGDFHTFIMVSLILLFTCVILIIILAD